MPKNRFIILKIFFTFLLSFYSVNAQKKSDTLKVCEGVEEHGMKQGLWKYFHPSGSLQKEVFFTNDTANGKWIEYFTNGQVSLTSNYFEGLEDSSWQEFSPQGKLLVDGQYSLGDKTGTWKIYDNSGVLAQEINYLNDSLDGWTIIYTPKGGVLEKVFIRTIL